MSLILRIDVDRTYGKKNLLYHLLSRAASDLYFPKISRIYLTDLKMMLRLLNEVQAKSYVFFRKCTLPDKETMELISAGGHIAGLHLENSKTLDSFANEISYLRDKTNIDVCAFSKHGSGQSKYGKHHYAPYEPEKYIEWAEKCKMKLFLGNGENPLLLPETYGDIQYFPSAFWLEPHWRDTEKFTVNWLIEEAKQRDIVCLVHPENILSDPELTKEFIYIVENSTTRLLS